MALLERVRCGGFLRSGTPGRATRAMLANSYAPPGRAERTKGYGCRYFSGIGVPRSMGTAVTLFFGEPSISKSE